MTEEKMVNHSFALYPSTHKEYMKLKEELKMTHDEMIKRATEVIKEANLENRVERKV